MLGRYRIREYDLDNIRTYDWLCIFGIEFDLMDTNTKSFPMSTSMKRLYLKRAIRTPLSTHSSDKINEIELNLVESIPILFHKLGLPVIKSNVTNFDKYCLRSEVSGWNHSILLHNETIPPIITSEDIEHVFKYREEWDDSINGLKTTQIRYNTDELIRMTASGRITIIDAMDYNY